MHQGDEMSAAVSSIPPLTAAVKKSRALNLAEILPPQMEAIRSGRHVPVGQMLWLMLGGCDDSAYFQDPVNAAIAPLTRVQGLSLQWEDGTHPRMVEMGARDSGTFLFPDGIKAPPLISDPRSRRLSPTEPMVPKIPQNLDYYASGRIIGRDGMEYYVLQPVEWIGVRIPTTLVRLRGETDPFSGTKVALLFSKNKCNGVHWAFLVKGKLRFL
jgi:hypothetical protein